MHCEWIGTQFFWWHMHKCHYEWQVASYHRQPHDDTDRVAHCRHGLFKTIAKSSHAACEPRIFSKGTLWKQFCIHQASFSTLCMKGFDCHLQTDAMLFGFFNFLREICLISILQSGAQTSSVSCVMSRKTCIIAVCWHCFGHINIVVTLGAANSSTHSVVASYKPPMLVTWARFRVCA